MTFFRIKKIKGKEYVYFVKNLWTKRGTRQKVSRYLGKLIRLKKHEDIDQAVPFLDDNSKLLDSLIERELLMHGFSREDDSLVHGDIVYNNYNVVCNNRPCVLHLNEGYFCKKSLDLIRKFSHLGDESETATALASVFVNAGLQVPQDIFIMLFRKVYKQDQITRLISHF